MLSRKIFSLIGKLVSSSGFEDVVFQAKLHKKGSLNGVISTFSEALEQLLLERFLNVTGKSIPSDFLLASLTNVVIDMQSPENLEFVNDFMKFQEDIRNAHAAVSSHKAVEENNFGLCLMSWKYFLPIYFALNKQKYALYGAFYVNVLENIATVYPGLEEIIEEKGWSVQGQEYCSLHTATDQRGEQTLNHYLLVIL